MARTSNVFARVEPEIKEQAYLLAALFNAPSTMDNHYTMLVNHDLNGGN